MAGDPAGPTQAGWEAELAGLRGLLALLWERLGSGEEAVSGRGTRVGKEAWLPCEKDGNSECGVQVSALGTSCSGSHRAGRKLPFP